MATELQLQATLRKLDVKLARQIAAVAETRAHIEALTQLEKTQREKSSK